MREIEFRGISRDTGRFVYGMLMYSCSDSGLVIVETVNAPPTMEDPCGDTINVYHGIRQGTEGQFIGLKDKSSTKIYEGDILFNNENCVIKFETGGFIARGKAFFIIPSYFWNCEIIGNVHQNKELAS